MLGALSWFFLFVLGGAGQPQVVTKMTMNKRVRDARHILPVSMLAYVLAALLWISIGLAMRALVLQGTHPVLAAPDAAAPEFLQSYAHPVLAGVVFAGLFAAIMSTADAFLNIGAAAVVHDIPRALTGSPLKRELLWARIATAAIALLRIRFPATSRAPTNRQHLATASVIGVIGMALALFPWERPFWYFASLYDLMDDIGSRCIVSESELEELKDDVRSQLEDTQSECQDNLDNMPESLQYAPTGELLHERIDALDSAMSDIEAIEPPDQWDEIDDLATLRQIWSTPSGQAARLADEKAVEICRAAQAAMDSTADRSAFVDMPWVPPELQEIVNVTFGCTPEERS